jgi:predicted RND superfamily exporter protein
MIVLLLIAIFVMYIILGILYESYIQPITVLSTLPVASLGGLATLQLFGMPLDLYGFIGLFLLLGLIKKNGIMLVDFAIMRRREGLGVEAAAVEAAVERLRPILMTIFAAIFGALPMAMGFGADGSSRQPMGLCIVGGLIVAQILTLFCTPVFYVYMEYLQERYLDKIAFFKRGEGELKEAGPAPAIGDRHYSHRFPQIKHGFWAIRIREDPWLSLTEAAKGQTIGLSRAEGPLSGRRPVSRFLRTIPAPSRAHRRCWKRRLGRAFRRGAGDREFPESSLTH